MRLDLYRKFKTANATIGELYVNGAFFCFTLEDVVRAEGVKVKHQTAIPAGTYEIVMTWSNRFQKVMPRLVNVPMFDGILIHAGNTAADTSGCILVGRKRGDDSITESRSAFAELFNLLGKSATQSKVTIQIHQLPGTHTASAPTQIVSAAPVAALPTVMVAGVDATRATSASATTNAPGAVQVLPPARPSQLTLAGLFRWAYAPLGIVFTKAADLLSTHPLIATICIFTGGCVVGAGLFWYRHPPQERKLV